GVLNVAGAVRQDEATAIRREIAVRHVDRDALLALGTQAISQEGKVDPTLVPTKAAVGRRAGNGVERVSKNGLRIVKEAAHQSGLAIIYRAGSSEAEQGCGQGCFQPGSQCIDAHLEVAVLLAVFHGCLGDAVICSGGATFGQGGGSDFNYDVGHGAGIGLDGTRAGHVAHGAVANQLGDDFLVRQRFGNLAYRTPHAVAGENLTLVGVVQAGELDVLTLDVAPDVQLGPVADGERTDVLAHGVAAVVQVPQLRALVARVPLTEFVTQAQDALLGAGLVLVTAAATENGVELFSLGGINKRNVFSRGRG